MFASPPPSKKTNKQKQKHFIAVNILDWFVKLKPQQVTCGLWYNAEYSTNKIKGWIW